MKLYDWFYKKKNEWTTWTQARSKQLYRRIEYARLKRIRKQRVPQYTYCKNCGTKLMGMYCYQCGQYALDTEQPFWKYIRQYFENVYQFDGKVWQTLYRLFASPGFLTKEFNLGKINSYVHPFRLYMFIATVFFMVFFYVASTKSNDILKPELFAPDLEGAEEVTWVADTSVVVMHAEQILKVLKKNEVPNIDNLFQISPSLVTDTNFKSLDCSRVKMPTPWIKELLVPVSKEELPDGLRPFLKGISSETVVYEWKALKNYKEKSFQIRAFKDMFMADLSKYTPFLMMFLLPVFALLTRWIFRKSKLNYMSHFVCALHINSVFLLLVSVPLIVFLLGIEVSRLKEFSIWFFVLYLFGYMLFTFKRVFALHWFATFRKTVAVYFLFYLIFTLLSASLILGLLLLKAQELDYINV